MWRGGLDLQRARRGGDYQACQDHVRRIGRSRRGWEESLSPGADGHAGAGCKGTEWKQAYAEFADAGIMFMRSGKPNWDKQTIDAEKKMQDSGRRWGNALLSVAGLGSVEFQVRATRRMKSSSSRS